MNIVMKLKNIILLTVVTLSVTFSSCYEEKMEWNSKDGDVTINEIPLKYDEKLALYKTLDVYNKENILLGVGIDLTNYMEDATYKALVDENYKAITVGYHMKHGAMVTGNGTLNFNRVDQLLEALPSGMGVFGHTLVWHSNQNGDYLRGLIAPTVIPAPAGTNLLSNGDFENDLTGWNSWGGGKQTVEISTEIKLGGKKALKAETNSSAANYWDLQIKSEDIPTIAGHQYEISFYIKSEGEGEVRLSFNGMSNGYPWVNGGVTANTSSAWKEITYNTSTIGSEFTATGSSMSFQIDLGGVADMTYYIDNVRVVDLNTAVDDNLFPEGNFEAGNIDGWSKNNPGKGIEITSETKKSGSYAVKMESGSSSANAWDLQLTAPEISVTSGHEYEISFYIKSDGTGKGRVSFSGMSNGYPWVNGAEAFDVSTAWKQVIYNTSTIGSTFSATGSAMKINFDLGYLPDMAYYIDDIIVKDLTTGTTTKALKKTTKSGPTYVEKTDKEKAEIIDAAMKSWIFDMVGHYKSRVHDWDVVNESMSDTGTLRKGDGKGDSGDTFHWQDFLGKDYAVKAFRYAKEAGADGVLFINDYNLEASTAKLDGFLDYVKYIESQGITIGGLGTQMHVHINYTTKDGIDNMFKKMAETGKLIKVSELDVQVGTTSPSMEQLNLQSDMYQYVIESYIKNVPASQRYGLTIWGLTDQYSWIENEALSMWDADYARKPAYKGVANGLYGEDASAGWAYEDIVNAAKE